MHFIRSLFFGLSVLFFCVISTHAWADLNYRIVEGARGANVQKDYVTAFRLYLIAAEHGDPWPQMRIGMMYADGEGTQRDYIQAYKWYTIASQSPWWGKREIPSLMTTNKGDALKHRQNIMPKMSPQDIAMAEQLVKNWKPTEKFIISSDLATKIGPEYENPETLKHDIEEDAGRIKTEALNKERQNASGSEIRLNIGPDRPRSWPGDGWPGRGIPDKNLSIADASYQKRNGDMEHSCFDSFTLPKLHWPEKHEAAHGAHFDELKFSRTTCFGACPAYDITIKADGTLFYQGNIYVETIGLVKSSLSQKQMDALNESLDNANLVELSTQDFSKTCMTDMPTVLLSMTSGGKPYGVHDYHGNCIGGIDKLRQLENDIDKIVNSAQWIGNRKWQFGEQPSNQDQIKRYIGMAQEGDSIAQRNLGDTYAEKCGVRGNVEAVNWWQKAAETDPESINRLAAAYAGGKGVERNYIEAANLWRKVAEGKHSKTEDYIRLAAEAQRFLGHLYMEGKGYDTDYAEAYYWYSLAADNMIIRDGYEGTKEQTTNFRNIMAEGLTPERLDAANKRLQAAKFSIYGRAENGDPAAQYALGQKYTHDPNRNIPETLKWFQKSAHQGYQDAQRALGLLYASVQNDVPYSPVESVFWIGLLQKNSGRAATAVYKEELAHLTPEQVAAVNKRIKEWVPGPKQVP